MSRGYQKIDVSEAMGLRVVNKLTFAQIARYFNVSPQAVHKALSGLVSDQVDTATITQKRADVLAHQHFRAVSAITQEKLDCSSARDLAVTSKLLFTQYRLESNLSVSNTASTFAQLVEKSFCSDGL